MPTTPSLTDQIATAAAKAASVVAASTVTIGRDGRGTGIIIGPNKVLTNAHNLRDRTTQIGFDGGRTAQASLSAVDADGDLAVLDVDTASAVGLLWAEESPKQGDVVFAASRTADGVRVAFGTVSAVGLSFRGPRGRLVNGSLEHTAPVMRGGSGGPLVDAAGRLVAINTHRIGRGFYLALPGDSALKDRIAELAAGRSVEPRRLGVALASSDVAAKLRRSVGLSERAGVLVRGVEVGSPADAAGLREGDLIVKAGAVITTTTDDLHVALQALTGDEVVLTIVRGNDESTATVRFTAEVADRPGDAAS